MFGVKVLRGLEEGLVRGLLTALVGLKPVRRFRSVQCVGIGAWCKGLGAFAA